MRHQFGHGHPNQWNWKRAEIIYYTFTRNAYLSYSDRLDRLELQTLEYRRLIADLVLYYNIVHGLSCINVTSFFTPSNNSSLRGHDFRFLIPISKLDIRRHFFAHRSINAWNSLPASVVSATGIFAFKRSLYKIDLCMLNKVHIINAQYMSACNLAPSYFIILSFYL